MNSKLFKLNWKQIVKGLIITVVGAALNAVKDGLINGNVDPKQTAVVGAVAGLGYITTTFCQNEKGEFLKTSE